MTRKKTQLTEMVSSICRTILLSTLLAVPFACQTEEDTLYNEDKLTLPVVFNLQTEGNEQSTAKERNAKHTLPQQKVAREVVADHVALYVYQRPVDLAYKNSWEGFVADTENGTIILPCVKQNSWPELIAKGSVNIRKNYEYRIVALGYSEKKGENKSFEKTGNRFDHAQIHLLKTSKGYVTPEFFYGAPVIDETSRDTLFSFAQVKQNSSMLEGWLYRGVAGIELELSNISKDISNIELLTDTLHTAVNLQHYDEFLTPRNKETAGNYLLGEEAPKDNNLVKIINPNILPICTNLKIRATKLDGTQEIYQLRLKETSTTPSQLTRSIPDDGGNGTGIITGKPDYPDPDHPDKPSEPSPYQICFKRNHYYKIKGDFTQMNNMKYVLEVVVNPYWEKDINLPLEKI